MHSGRVLLTEGPEFPHSVLIIFLHEAVEFFFAFHEHVARLGARVRADDAGVFELIDDAYNANPASVAAALAVLAAASPGPGGRRVAVLGDMLELGPGEAQLHAALAPDPGMAAVDIVHCAGPRMRHLVDALPAARRGLWRAEADALAAMAAEIARPGDIVLVKGSLGARTGRVVEALRGLAAAPAGLSAE